MSCPATIPRYTNGRYYSTPVGQALDDSSAPGMSPPPPLPLDAATSWATFWKEISAAMTKRGYSNGSQALYRSVLRNLYRHSRRPPGRVDATLVKDYLAQLSGMDYSWHWTGMTISVLRTVFDKLCGQSVTTQLITPKRSSPLPEILNRREIRDLLAAATTPRDQLLLGLLYGCGLKPGELNRLTWADIDSEAHILRVITGATVRELDLPPDLRPILAYGKSQCPADDFIFQGRYAGTPLGLRMIELIIRGARQSAGILKPVTAMTLRHSYAVHSLEAGATIRAVQEALGHLDIRTTLRYRRCMLPENLESPLDILRRNQGETAASGEPDVEPTPTPPAHDLFDKPPSIETLELPFRNPATPWATVFHRLLKTQIIGRFLGLRRFSRRGS